MNFSRFLTFAAAVALSGAMTGGALAQTRPEPTTPPPPEPQVLSKGVWLIRGAFLGGRQPDGNTVVFEGAKGLVMLDTGRHRWHRQAILDFAKVRQVPILAIVNSHWHLDHVSGNPDIKAAYPQLKVYASNAIEAALSGFLKDSAAGAREYLKSPNLPPQTAEDIRNDLATVANGAALKPDVVVRESITLAVDGMTLALRLAPNGPTAGDLWLHAPTRRIVAVGDLVTLPVPFLDTACVGGWKSALTEVWQAPFEILVPGHGKPMSRSEFAQYRAAFDAFIDCANSTKDKRECAAGWVKDAGSLIETNGMSPKRAEGMAEYYISEVLRPNGGNSKFCKVPGA